MKNSPYFLIALLFFSCSKDESTVDRKSVLETALGVEASTSPFGGDELFYADVVYGSGSRNHLDIILPQVNELLGKQIATIHNLGFYLALVRQAREKIIAGEFAAWKNKMVQQMNKRL